MDFYTKEYFRRLDSIGPLEEPRPFFIDFHKMTVNKSCLYPEHVHRQYEVIWVIDGPYFCLLNGLPLTVQEGEVLIIKPGDSHQDQLRKGQKHYVLHFRLNSELFSRETAAGDQIAPDRLDEGDVIFPEMEKITAETQSGNDFTGSLQDAWLAVLFWNIIRLYPISRLSDSFRNHSKREVFIQKLNHAFFQSYRQRTTVEQIAEHMGLSKRTLTSRCRRYLNDSPGKVFLKYRIDKAKELLAGSDLSIKEISYHLGFDTPYNFSRAFKRLCGISPSSYNSSSEE